MTRKGSDANKSTKDKIRKLYLEFGKVFQTLAREKSKAQIDVSLAHTTIMYDFKRIDLWEDCFKTCADINKRCEVQKLTAKAKIASMLYERIQANDTNKRKSEMIMNFDELKDFNVDKYLESSGLKKDENGEYILDDTEGIEDFSEMFRFKEAQGSNEYEVMIHNWSKNSLINYSFGYHSHGPSATIRLVQEYDYVGKTKKKVLKSESVEYQENMDCFLMDENGKYVLHQFIVEQECPINVDTYVSHSGFVYKTKEMCEDSESKAIFEKRNKSYIGYRQINKRSEIVKYYDRDNDSDQRTEYIETKPSLDYIYQRHYKLTDKNVVIIPDCFIIIREVVQKKTNKEKKEVKERVFMEPVFVTLTRGNSKLEEDMNLDSRYDYRFRIFWISQDNEEPATIKTIVAKRDEVINLLSDLKNKFYDENLHVSEKKNCLQRICFMYDRRIALKIHLKTVDPPEGSEEKQEIITKEKEYQTKSQLKERMISMKKIVQKETAGVRYSSVEEEKRPPRKRVEAPPKEMRRKKDPKSREKVKPIEKVRDPNEIFEFGTKLKMKEEDLHVIKEINYTLLEDNIKIREKIIEPNLNYVVKFLIKINPELKMESFDRLAEDTKHSPLKFHLVTGVKEEEYYKSEDKWNIMNSTREYGIPTQVVVDFDYQENCQIFKNWKPDEDRRKEFLKVRGYFRVDENNETLKFFDYDAQFVFNDFFKYHYQDMEKEIIQNVIYSPSMGPLFFSEFKCKIIQNKNIMSALLGSTLYPKNRPVPTGDFPENITYPKVHSSFVEDVISRTTTVNVISSRQKIVFTVTEPNLQTAYAYLNLKANNHGILKKVWDLNRKIETLNDLVQVEKMNKMPLDASPVPCVGHEDCVLANKLNTFMIESKVTIKCEELKFEESYVEPKLVQLKCKEGNKVHLQFMDHKNYGQISLTRKNQILSTLDLSEALNLLEKETEESRDEIRPNIAYTKYKQRIQRCMNSVGKRS